MKKIKLITDTASDLTLEIAKEYDIHLIPINLNIDGKQLKDKYDISNDEFYNYLETHDEVPKTAQISVGEHIDEFKKFVDEYSIIYVPISSKASGTNQSAQLAKNEILEENPDADITIVDSMSFSYCYGYWITEAAKMAKKGASKEEIVEMLEDRFSRTRAVFAVDTLDYLQKGGRISSTAKIVANVLDITPILSIEDGLVVSHEKVRGKKKVVAKMLEILNEEAEQNPENPIIIMHGNNIEKADMMKEKLLEKTSFTNTVYGVVGPCIGIHTGPGAHAYVYLTKKE